jgi:hypothetical protein
MFDCYDIITDPTYLLLSYSYQAAKTTTKDASVFLTK